MKKSIIFFAISYIIFLLVGCANKEYLQLYSNFKVLYLDVTKDIDLKEPYVSISLFNQETITSKLQEMREIESKMKGMAETEREKGLYCNVNSYLNVLEFLQYAAGNIKNLTEEERGTVDTDLTLSVMYRKSIEDGDV